MNRTRGRARPVQRNASLQAVTGHTRVGGRAAGLVVVLVAVGFRVVVVTNARVHARAHRTGRQGCRAVNVVRGRIAVDVVWVGAWVVDHHYVGLGDGRVRLAWAGVDVILRSEGLVVQVLLF